MTTWLRRWRVRREVLRWLDGSEKVIAELCRERGRPAPSPFPRDVARAHPQLAVESMLALLRALKASEDGGDALAVLEEHMPLV